MLLEKKIKEKANELMKREQKLILVEEELKNKIKDTARQIGNKEEEVLNYKKRYNEEILKFQKENKVLTQKNEKLLQDLDTKNN